MLQATVCNGDTLDAQAFCEGCIRTRPTLRLTFYFCDPQSPWHRGRTRTPMACSESVTVLWAFSNLVLRPHSSLGNVPPAVYADRHAVKPQQGRRFATPRAPRPAPLLHRASWAQMKIGLYSSGHESWGSESYRSAKG